jgi:hypothetical protein
MSKGDDVKARRGSAATSRAAEAQEVVERRLTVGYTPGLDCLHRMPPVPVPLLRLGGRWLKSAGFPIGTRVRVEVESKRLVLTAVGHARER